MYISQIKEEIGQIKIVGTSSYRWMCYKMFYKCGHAFIFTENNISKLMGFSLMVIVLYPWHSFCCQMAKQNRWQFPGSSGKIVCWYFSIELVGRQIFCKDTSRFQSNTFFKQFGILSIRYLRSKQKEFNRKKNLFPVWG